MSNNVEFIPLENIRGHKHKHKNSDTEDVLLMDSSFSSLTEPSDHRQKKLDLKRIIDFMKRKTVRKSRSFEITGT
jgi:hypothetical protein